MADWKNLLDWQGAVNTEEGDGAAKVNNSWLSSLEEGQVAATGIQWAVNKILNQGHS